MHEDRLASLHPAEPHRTESQRLRSILATEHVKPLKFLEFTDDNFVAEVLDVEDRLVVFDFWSESCVLCRFVHEAALRLRDELKAVKFGRVDVTRNPEIVKAFDLKAIPHIVAVLRGDVVFEIVGGRTYEELKERITPFMAVIEGTHGSNGNGENGG